MSDDTTRPKPVARRLRFEILRRDNHQCRYCGATAPDVKLAVDHVIPRALGGSDNPTNLVTACVDCNAGKTSVAPDQATVADVSTLQIEWQRALEEAARIAKAERQPKPDPVLDEFVKLWNVWTDRGAVLDLPERWEASIRVFSRNGLDLDDLQHYIGVSMRKGDVAIEHKFRYFAGCCWKEITRRTELAQELMRAAAPTISEPEPEPFHSELPEPWAIVDGERLYTRPDCPNCHGNGYTNSEHAWAPDECWCISNVPYEVVH
jgi:hypothetical protein